MAWFLQDVPRDLLENGDPFLEINFVEATAPRLTGTLAASDGLPIDALVYSRRSGYPDLFLGIVSSGAFDLAGFGMLEFDGMASEIVFEPVLPFNRTLTPDDPVVIPVDMTQTDEAPVGDITFTVAPRTAASPITFRGQFIDDAINPVAGLELEVRDGGGTLITPIVSGPDGWFEVTVANGQATVEATNLVALGFVDLPAQPVDFGQNGSTVLDIGQRRLVPLDHTIPRARLVPQPVRVCEGAGSVALTLELDRAAPAPVSVDYQTVADTATAGTDYTAITGTATFPSGTTQLPLTVTILDDGDVEGDEQLTVELTNPSGVLLSSAPTTIVIDDDDDGTPLGDATQDCLVDAADLAAMVELIDTGATTPAQADCNLSGGPITGADQACTAQLPFATP